MSADVQNEVEIFVPTQRSNAKLKKLLGGEAPNVPVFQTSKRSNEGSTNSLRSNTISSGEKGITGNRQQSHTISAFPSKGANSVLPLFFPSDLPSEKPPRPQRPESGKVERVPSKDISGNSENAPKFPVRKHPDDKWDRPIVETFILKKLVEEKRVQEENMRKELQKYDIKSWNDHVRSLRERLKQLESGDFASEPIQVMAPVQKTEQEIELEKKKGEIEQLEKKNLQLRDEFDEILKVSKENRSQIEELEKEAGNLRSEVKFFRKQELEKKKILLHEKEELFVAWSEFEAENVGDLSLKEGDYVQVTCKGTDGWWEGFNLETNETGVFPSTFVKIFEGDLSEQSGKTAVAMFDYVAQSEDEISFSAGDQLKVIHENENGWWFALHVSSQSKGLYPSTFASYT